MEPENKASTPQSINDLSALNNEYNQDTKTAKKRSMLKITGILLIIVGILIVVHWVYITTSPDFIDTLLSTGVYDNLNITRADLVVFFNFCGIIAICLSLFTIIGGLLAVQGRMFWFAVIGGIVGIFALAPLFFFVPNILSFIGILLIIRFRKDFQK